MVIAGESSTFNALHVQADDGLGISADVTTTEGAFFLDGDVDKSASFDSDRIRFDLGIATSPTHRRRRVDRMLRSKTELTLSSVSGSALYECPLTLYAADGITIMTDVLGSGNQPLVLNADYETYGNGLLTVDSNMDITSTDSVITITAFDLDLKGSISVGNSTLILTGSTADELVGIGEGQGDFIVDNAEMQRMTSRGGLSLGNAETGSMSLVNITNAASQEIGTLTLIATRPSYNVTFSESGSTFNKGLVIEASFGVILSESVISQGITTMLAGTGTLTIENAKLLSTTNNLLQLTADDFDIPGFISTGNASLHMRTMTSKDISVGNDLAGAANIDTSEFQRVTSGGLQIGAYGGPNTDIYVENLGATATNNVAGICTFLATVDDSQITFQTTASTFYALSAQADNGLISLVDLYTTVGNIHMDADYENSSTADIQRSIFGDQISLNANDQLILESHSGTMRMNGAFTLSAGNGILITGSLNQLEQVDEMLDPLIIYADSDGINGGMFNASNITAITTDSNSIIITASDIDLRGTLSTSITQEEAFDEAPTSLADTPLPTLMILGSEANQTIAMGVIAGDMQLGDAELGRMTTHGGMTLGATSPMYDSEGNMWTNMLDVQSGVAGDILAGGVTNNNTDAIGRLTLMARNAGAQITFEQEASTFNKVPICCVVPFCMPDCVVTRGGAGFHYQRSLWY